MPLLGLGSGKEVPSSGDNLSKRLERLEELVRSISGDLRDIKQQQQGLSVAMLHLEKVSLGVDDGTPSDGNAVHRWQQWLRHQAVTTTIIPSLRRARLAALCLIIIGGAQTPNQKPSATICRLLFTKLSFPSSMGQAIPWLGSAIVSVTSCSTTPQNISTSSTPPSTYWIMPDFGITNLSSTAGRSRGRTSSSWCTPGSALRSRRARLVN
jgi:hypothetical protein